jgi:Tfp pilus assembly protein PilN
MTTFAMFAESLPKLKRTTTERAEKATQRFLMALAVTVLTAALIVVGICTVVIAQTMNAIQFVMKVRRHWKDAREPATP